MDRDRYLKGPALRIPHESVHGAQCRRGAMAAVNGIASLLLVSRKTKRLSTADHHDDYM